MSLLIRFYNLAANYDDIVMGPGRPSFDCPLLAGWDIFYVVEDFLSQILGQLQECGID